MGGIMEDWRALESTQAEDGTNGKTDGPVSAPGQH